MGRQYAALSVFVVLWSTTASVYAVNVVKYGSFWIWRFGNGCDSRGNEELPACGWK